MNEQRAPSVSWRTVIAVGVGVAAGFVLGARGLRMPKLPGGG